MKQAPNSLNTVANNLTEVFRRRVWPMLWTFATGQGIAQALNLLSGLLVLRWLTLGDYGKYGLIYSFQSTVNLLIDLGFSNTIVALVGQRFTSREVIGNYVRAGRALRLKVFCIVLPAAGLAFLYLSSNQDWMPGSRVLSLLSIAVSVFASGIQSYYGAPLLIARQLKRYYSLQVGGAGLRILGTLILHELHMLDALAAVWLNCLATLAVALCTKTSSRALIDEPDRPDPIATREMIHYVLPILPGNIFFALQGQIAVFVIAIVSSGVSVARVSALSRLGQIFVFLGAFNSVALEPWFARSKSSLLYRRFAIAFAVAGFISVAMVVTASLVPNLFLSILGQSYLNLERELVWFIASSCAGYLIGVVWTACSARRFLFWRFTWYNMIAILGSQIAFAYYFGVATPLRAVQFGLASGVASLLVHFANFVYGVRHGPRAKLAMRHAA